jgi:hypothetical protein
MTQACQVNYCLNSCSSHMTTDLRVAENVVSLPRLPYISIKQTDTASAVTWNVSKTLGLQIESDSTAVGDVLHARKWLTRGGGWV